MSGLNEPGTLDIEFTRNQALNLDFTWKDSDGVAVPLKSGSDNLYIAKFEIESNPDGGTNLYTASTAAGTITLNAYGDAGRILVTAPDTVTVLWAVGTYFHDFRIWTVANPNSTPIYLFKGKFKVKPAVTV